MTRHSWAIDVAGIVSWDDRPGELLDDVQRQRIAEAVKAVVHSQWGDNIQIVEAP
jgi:hypothetical protein